MPLPDQWWLSFGDDDLNELMAIALGGNFNLKIAWDRLAKSEAMARKSGSDLGLQADYDGRVRWDGVKSEDFEIKDWRYTLRLRAEYEVDLWGRIRSGHEAALLDALGSREDVATAAITLTADIASKWYELAEGQKQIRVLENQIDINKRVMEILDLQFRQGQAQAADVLRQRNLIENSQGLLILAKRDARLLEYQLSVLLGMGPGGELPIEVAEMVELPSLPATGLPAELLRRRPDVRSAYRAVQSADMSLAVAIADQYPKFSLIASGDSIGNQGSDIFNNWLLTLAGNVAGPILDGGRRKSEVEIQEAVVSETINEYCQIVLDSLQEVEQAIENEQRQVEYIESLAKQLEISNLVIERARDSYLNGQLNYIDVLSALTSQQELERKYVKAIRERIGYRIDLCKSIAGGWELGRPDLREFIEVETSPLSPDEAG